MTQKDIHLNKPFTFYFIFQIKKLALAYLYLAKVILAIIVIIILSILSIFLLWRIPTAIQIIKNPIFTKQILLSELQLKT
jgi:hypothetical protein